MMVLATVVLAAAAIVAVSADCAVSDASKVDCGYVGITQSGCESKGCCWQQSQNSAIPWCFYQSGAATSCYGYQVSGTYKQPLHFHFIIIFSFSSWRAVVLYPVLPRS